MKKWSKLFFIQLLLFVSLISTVKAELFQAKTVVQPFEQDLEWIVGGANRGPATTFKIVSKPTINGKGAGELTYEFLGTGQTYNFCEYTNRIQLPDGSKKLSFWVHGDASGHPFNIRITDASGEFFQFNCGLVNWQGWRQLTVDLTGKPLAHWAGNNDGRMDYPLTFNSFIIEAKDFNFAGRGRIVVDELEAEFERPIADSVEINVDSKQVGNIFTADEPVVFNFSFKNWLQATRNIEVSYLLSNPSERNLPNSSFKVELGPLESINKSVTIPVRFNGCFEMKVHFRSKDNVVKGQKTVQFSRVLPPMEKQGLGNFGMCTHLGFGNRDIEKTTQAASLSATQWIRDEMLWDRAETVKGQIRVLPEWDRWVDEALARGLNILLILDYGNPFYDGGQAPHTPEGIEAFVRYATTLVSHFKGRINHFQIWNEWNGGMGNRTYRPAEDYATLLKAVYPAIKKVNPEAVVIGAATAGADFPWIEKILKAGSHPYMDAISIQPYCFPVSPDEGGFVKNLKLAQELMIRYGGEKPIWITETGWPTHQHKAGVSEALSGFYAARIGVLRLASGVPGVNFWYDLQNDGLLETYQEHNFGLIRCWYNEDTPWSAKENFITYNTAANMLYQAEFVGEYETGKPNLKIYRLAKQAQDLLVLWTLRDIETVSLKLGEKQVVVTDHLGNFYPLTPTEGVVTLSVTQAPLYLTGDFEVCEITSAKFQVDNPKLKVVAGEETIIRVQLPCLSQEGSLLPDLPRGWQIANTSFDPNQGSLELKLKVSLQAQEKEYELNLYPTVGQSVLGRLTLAAEVISPLEAAVQPVALAEGWGLSIKLTNHSQLNSLGGTLNLIEPLQWAKTFGAKIIPELEPGASQTLKFPVPAPPGGITDLKLQVRPTRGSAITLERPVSFLGAKRAIVAPKIDGDLSEWEQRASFTMLEPKQVKQIKDWGGPEDLSASGSLLWDDNYLYLALEVTDNKHVQTDVLSDIWRGDGIQLAIDPARAVGIGSQGVHEFGFALAESQLTSWRWIAAYGKEIGELENINYAISREGTKTTYEIAIPWSELFQAGTEVKPGTLIGFSLLINDNDGQGRRGWIEYMGGIGSSKDPYAFGDLILCD